MKYRKYATTAISLLIILGMAATPALAKDKAAKEAKRDLKLEKQMRNISDYFEMVMLDNEKKIPGSLLKKAEGIVIMRQLKAGLGVGFKGGGGVALVRDKSSGGWSPPAFLNAGEGSIGLQIGGQVIDSIYLIMNEEGMKILTQPQYRIGVDAAAVAGPHAADAEAKYSGNVPILVYTDAGGLYAGASFEGGFLVPDKKANEDYYDREGLIMSEILFDRKVKATESGERLIDLINKHSR